MLSTVFFVDLPVSLGFRFPSITFSLRFYYFLSKSHQNSNAPNNHHIGCGSEIKTYKASSSFRVEIIVTDVSLLCNCTSKTSAAFLAGRDKLAPTMTKSILSSGYSAHYVLERYLWFISPEHSSQSTTNFSKRTVALNCVDDMRH